MSRFACMVFLLCAACGGRFAGDGGVDASSDASASDASGEVTYDACSGSDGVKLCGGACGINDCPLAAACSSTLGVCIDTTHQWTYGTCADPNFVSFAKDGTLCVPGGIADGPKDMFWLESADPGYAIMYAINGYGSWCHYADRSTYDGTAIPDAPASCPATSGFQLCGGACGDCPAGPYPKGQYCTGRSPLHPYSLCLTSYENVAFTPGDSCVRGAPQAGGCMGNAQNPASACLTFKVSDADQPFADQNGICTEKSICLAAAAAYPGGAYCTP